MPVHLLTRLWRIPEQRWQQRPRFSWARCRETSSAWTPVRLAEEASTFLDLGVDGGVAGMAALHGGRAGARVGAAR